jgi:hypothetical protein
MARDEALARIIRPIVEGQVRAYLHAHPEGEAHPGQLATGIGKRVTHDPCSPRVVERIRLALKGAGCGGDAMHGDSPEAATGESG